MFEGKYGAYSVKVKEVVILCEEVAAAFSCVREAEGSGAR
jgi:hypothetical protein